MHYVLFIVSQNGGLIYDKVLWDKIVLTVNEKIRLSSTFHSIYAISAELTPNSAGNTACLMPNLGIQILETQFFNLVCFHAHTGVKIILSSSTDSIDTNIIIKKLYDVYSEYVNKNPFQQVTKIPLIYS